MGNAGNSVKSFKNECMGDRARNLLYFVLAFGYPCDRQVLDHRRGRWTLVDLSLGWSLAGRGSARYAIDQQENLYGIPVFITLDILRFT
jgi:hypothetical protein